MPLPITSPPRSRQSSTRPLSETTSRFPRNSSHFLRFHSDLRFLKECERQHEILEERGDLLREAVRESFEDVAMVRAIQDGEKSPLTSRRKIFQRLDREA